MRLGSVSIWHNGVDATRDALISYWSAQVWSWLHSQLQLSANAHHRVA